jgi:hypothetical protein
MTQKFQKRFDTVQKYKEAVEHAEALGFEPVEIQLYGTWQAEKEPIFVDRIDPEDIDKVGRKYIYVRQEYEGSSREVWRFSPEPSNFRDDGDMVVEFSGSR